MGARANLKVRRGAKHLDGCVDGVGLGEYNVDRLSFLESTHRLAETVTNGNERTQMGFGG